MKKFVCTLLSALLMLSLCACGAQQSGAVIDPQQVADALRDGAGFEGQMVAQSEEDLRYYFEVPEDAAIAGYFAAGATTEMVVAAQCADAAQAEALRVSMETYLADLKQEMNRYQPEELQRLDGALLTVSGGAVVLCVCGDNDAASAIMEEYLK